MEMSFTNQDEVLGVIEGMVTAGWADVLVSTASGVTWITRSF